jgi:hypothetical protein
MFIYTTIALNVFIQLLKHIYSESEILKKLKVGDKSEIL